MELSEAIGTDSGATAIDRSYMGPLVVHPSNPRYFADATGRPVYLTGSHTWAVVQDGGPDSPPAGLDWPAFLAAIGDYGHTFTRLWTWEHPRWASWWKGDYHFTPVPWERVGPGLARDGGPRFDLSRVNHAWLERLRNRVSTALEAGIYVSVMLFQGWSAGPKPDPWTGCDNPWMSHPFHRDNNINGIDGSPEDEEGHDRVHTLADSEVVAFQERYVRAVLDAVNEFPNVLYEIGNEHDGSPENTRWQYHMIDVVHEYDRSAKAFPHPVYMSAQWPDPRNQDLLAGPAAAIVPFAWRQPGDERWEYEPPAAHVGKVVLLDTDHLWGVGGNVDWVWRSFMRGYQPLYMDPWGYDHMDPLAPVGREDVRRALGAAARLAAEVDLAKMLPAPDIVSTGFALYDGDRTVIAYQPYEDRLCLNVGRDLKGATVEWRDLVDDTKRATGSIRHHGTGGLIEPPWPGPAVAVVRLRAPGSKESGPVR
jgi:hypothetical protein